MKKYLYRFVIRVANALPFDIQTSFTTYIKLQIGAGYVDKNGAPLVCPHCHSKKQKHVVRDMVNSETCELEVFCYNCHKNIGYWAYGSWMP